jgi:uncharacterized protein (DUF1778 family)
MPRRPPIGPEDINIDEWEEMPNAVRRHKAQSFFTFPISGAELTLIQEAAERQNQGIDEFIRKAALRAAIESNPEQIRMSREDAARLHAVLDSLIEVEAPTE